MWNDQESAIKDKLIQNIGIEIQRNNTASVAIGNEIANIHADRTNVDTEISQLTQTQKRLTKTLNRLKLDIDKQLKEKKKAETEAAEAEKKKV